MVYEGDRFFASTAATNDAGGPLPSELRSVAHAELRETDAIREHALAAMRDWIRKHPRIKKCRTDSMFLLRFLRTKKFSIPMAQDMLERYLTIRQIYPQWFANLSVDDPISNEILDSGYLVPLPRRDDHGRQVILQCAGRFDPYRYSSSQMARLHSLVVEVLMDDEESQIRGFCHLNDESGLSLAHLSLWSFSDIHRMLNCIQNSTPMRHKSTHFVNVPHYANKVFEFFLGLLSEKLRKRIYLHSTLNDLKENINPKILPKEYGGQMPLADMIVFIFSTEIHQMVGYTCMSDWLGLERQTANDPALGFNFREAEFKVKMLKHREAIAALEEMHIQVGKKETMELEDGIYGVAGSFRKLEVD